MSNEDPTPQPNAAIIGFKLSLSIILSSLAFSTFNTLPLRGRIA